MTNSPFEVGDHVAYSLTGVHWEVTYLRNRRPHEPALATLKSGMTGRFRYDIPVTSLILVKKAPAA